MSQACDANSLASLYTPLQGLPIGTLQPIIIALLCNISGMTNCDAQSLVALANNDICCLPTGTQNAIMVALLCQIANNGGGGGGGISSVIAGDNTISAVTAGSTVTLKQPTFTSALISIGDAFTWSVAHGLGAVPTSVQCVLHCISDDAGSGMVSGQEMDVSGVGDPGDGTVEFSVVWNATTVIITAVIQPLGNESQLVIPKTGVGNATAAFTSFSNFKFKVYAKL